MMNSKEITRFIESKTFVFGVLDILFLALPGIGVIFLYDQQLFISLDWIKLLLLSAAFNSPFVLLNTIFFSSISNSQKEVTNTTIFSDLTIGILMTSVLIDLGIGLLYLYGITFTHSLYILIAAEVGICIIALICELRSSKGKKNK